MGTTCVQWIRTLDPVLITTPPTMCSYFSVRLGCGGVWRNFHQNTHHGLGAICGLFERGLNFGHGGFGASCSMSFHVEVHISCSRVHRDIKVENAYHSLVGVGCNTGDSVIIGFASMLQSVHS